MLHLAYFSLHILTGHIFSYKELTNYGNIYWVGTALNIQFGFSFSFILITFGESLQAKVTFPNQNVSKLASRENNLKYSMDVDIIVVRAFLTLNDIYSNILVVKN